jgi:ubiquinol-cytochrome c reductase cytochrome c1 subunit
MFTRLSQLRPQAARWLKAGGTVVAGGFATGALLGSGNVHATSEAFIHPPHLHWESEEYLGAYNTANLRRGFEVYRQICSTCHSLQLINYRNLVGVTHTEDQAKALAASVEVEDGPNDEGEMYMRPGKLFDALPSPYANEEAARASNAGALPPDLSLIVKARHGGMDYVYALLTGYGKDPPAGFEVPGHLHFNPYFDGSAIGMAPPLQDDGIEYEDGTVATISQQAKDVTSFLRWCGSPEQDERKRTGMNFLIVTTTLFWFAVWAKRFRWSIFKTRRMSYTQFRE